MNYFWKLLEFLKQDNQELSNVASILTIIASLSLLFALGRFIKLIVFSIRRIYVRPIGLTEKEVKRYTKVYIKTRLGNYSPLSSIAFDTYSINDFIKKYIDKGEEQYHWVLGESGTGKTAFMINLYYLYNSKLFKKYDVFYVSLRSKEAIKQIGILDSQISSRKAVLLLDAFDESIEAIKDYRSAITLLEDTSKNFSKVIITSRTHFFDSEEDEPRIITAPRSILAEEEHYIKHYILPFSSIDVVIYLIKKYKYRLGIIYKAKKVIDNSLDIMARPLLLSFMDDILAGGKEFKYKYQVYNTLVNKWIDREVQVVKNYSLKQIDVIAYKDSFWECMYSIVQIMVINRNNHGDFSVTVSELNKICEKYNIEADFSKRPRTLLNRIGDNTFVFCHQSIYEYLLADAIRSEHYITNLDAEYVRALDQYKDFLEEMIESGALDDVLQKNTILLCEIFSEVFQSSDIPTVKIDVIKKQMTLFYEKYSFPLSSITIKQLHKLCAVIEDERKLTPVKLLQYDGHDPSLRNAYLVLYEKIEFCVGDITYNGKALFNIKDYVIELVSSENHRFNYWDVGLFVDDMPISIIWEFIVEQLTNTDINGRSIQTADEQPGCLTIELSLMQ